jgi:hypothetical protein
MAVTAVEEMTVKAVTAAVGVVMSSLRSLEAWRNSMLVGRSSMLVWRKSMLVWRKSMLVGRSSMLVLGAEGV